MKKWAIIIGVILVLAAIGSAVSGKKKEEEAIVRDQAAKEAAEVGVGEVFTDYKQNEVGADAKYKGKWVKIKGKVESIGKDITDDAYVKFDVSDSLFGVQAFVEKEHQGDLTGLAPGQVVVMVCQGEGKFGNVLFKKCKVVK